MYVKIHQSYRNVVAICDSELLGSKHEEGKRQLEIKESFFKDKEVSEQELIDIINRQMLEDATFNIVGSKSIDAAIKANLINPDNIDYIDKVPFTLVLI